MFRLNLMKFGGRMIMEIKPWLKDVIANLMP